MELYKNEIGKGREESISKTKKEKGKNNFIEIVGLQQFNLDGCI